MESMNSIAIFKAATISKSIASYFGFIDSVSSDVKKLLHQSFESGKRNLEYAQGASGEAQKQYIQRALGDFICAQGIEKDENLISSYLGTAMCQYLLGDTTNARVSLSRISSVTLSKSEIVKAATLDLAFPDRLGFLGGGLRILGIKGNREHLRILLFEECKRKALLAKI